MHKTEALSLFKMEILPEKYEQNVKILLPIQKIYYSGVS